jgi:hypothetical protein
MVNKEWYSKTLRKMILAFATGVKTESRNPKNKNTTHKTTPNCAGILC